MVHPQWCVIRRRSAIGRVRYRRFHYATVLAVFWHHCPLCSQRLLDRSSPVGRPWPDSPLLSRHTTLLWSPKHLVQTWSNRQYCAEHFPSFQAKHAPLRGLFLRMSPSLGVPASTSPLALLSEGAGHSLPVHDLLRGSRSRMSSCPHMLGMLLSRVTNLSWRSLWPPMTKFVDGRQSYSSYPLPPQRLCLDTIMA